MNETHYDNAVRTPYFQTYKYFLVYVIDTISLLEVKFLNKVNVLTRFRRSWVVIGFTFAHLQKMLLMIQKANLRKLIAVNVSTMMQKFRQQMLDTVISIYSYLKIVRQIMFI